MRFLLAATATALALAPSAHATPLVCLDPGHSIPPNGGSERIGPGSSTYKIKDGGGTTGEAKVVLQIARKTRRTLVDRGYLVAMTRTTPEFTYGKGGNIDRAKFCNRRHAALMIRIHADGSTDAGQHGAATLYPKWHKGWTDDILPQSRRAARHVQAKLVARTGAADRGLVRRGDITGFNWANVPVILVETGFMTNPTERRKLQSKRYQWKVARALAGGAAAFRPAG